MIQADLRTARQHPSYGMNGLILSAIVIAALAGLAALAHVLDGLFFMRRTADAFIRFISVWDIAMAFLGYLACAAGLSRHRVFPWLYLAYAVGFVVPRVALFLQTLGVKAGMEQMAEDQSFLQEIHLLQLIAILLCLSAVYILWSPAVRITYRHRLTRDEVRLIEQLQGAEPRLSLGPRGPERDDGGRDHERSAAPVRQRKAPVQEDSPVLARRSGRAVVMPEPSEDEVGDPLPALPSFFQPDMAAPRGGSGGAGAPVAGDMSSQEQAAAALAAATVAGALKRVSGRASGQQPAASPSGLQPEDRSRAAAVQAAVPAAVAPQPVAGAGQMPAQPPSHEASVAAAGAIVAGAQRRTAEQPAAGSPPASPAVPAAATAAPPVPRPQVQPPASPPAAAMAPPAPAAAAPPDAAAAAAAAAAAEEQARQRDDPAQRQLEAAAARQKLQEELEIDRRIARLRGLASGQVSALSIGLAMDRNPLAEESDEEGGGQPSDGVARSNTDERLGRLRAAALPPRNRGDSVRRRDDQALSEELPAAVHNLAIGEHEEPIQGAGPPRAESRLSQASGLSQGGTGPAASFQSRIDALLNRADAEQAWQGGSMPEAYEHEPDPEPESAPESAPEPEWQPQPAAIPPAVAPAPPPHRAQSAFLPAPGTGLPGAPLVPPAGGKSFPEPDRPDPPAGREEHEAPALPAAAPEPVSDVFAALLPEAGPVPEPAPLADPEAVLSMPTNGIPGLAALPADAGSDEVPPDPIVAAPDPAPAPVDEDELARSLADILPSVPPPAAAAGSGAPSDGGTADLLPGATAAVAGQGGDDSASGRDAAGEAAPGEGDPIEQRIEAMRILVDEGFLSQTEFDRRAAELRGTA